PDGTTGLTIADQTKRYGSRERYNRVRVDLEQIRRIHRENPKEAFSADEEIAENVAHELAHAMDVKHHGELPAQQLQDPSRLTIYDPDKKRISGLSSIPG